MYAYFVGLAWLACDKALQALAKPVFGEKICSGGAPRWQCCTKLWTQLVVMPALFYLSWAQRNYSMALWCEEAGRALFTTDGTRWYDWAFGYVFLAYLLEDLLLDTVEPLMIWHHIGCCVGHILAFAVLPYGFPYYFGGAVALEFGSALYNLYCLYPSAKGMAWSFLAAMTISNTVAACFCCTWLMLDFPIPAKIFAGIITAIFIVVRQKECITEIRLNSSPRMSAKSA